MSKLRTCLWFDGHHLEAVRFYTGLIPGSRLEIIEAAGHLPTMEQPDPTMAALIRWLEA